MTKSDTFTLRRLVKFACDFRERKGQYATLRDMEDNGFAKEVVDHAVKEKLVEELYVTLTTGAVVKGYKARSS